MTLQARELVLKWMSSISGLQGARNPGASQCEPRDKDERIRGIKWRRGWDLNPRYPLRYVRFRGGSFQPLTHLSASDNKELTSKPVRSVQVHLSRPFLAPLRISAL